MVMVTAYIIFFSFAKIAKKADKSSGICDLNQNNGCINQCCNFCKKSCNKRCNGNHLKCN